MVRTPCCDKTGLKKGSWTPEEDRKLAAYINRYGSWNWRQLPKFAGLSRCGKSCRLRWMNYLRPNLKRGNFSKEEEQLIINLHESLGNRWSTIAAKLPGRTDNEIKNYWHTYLKKLSRPIQGERPNTNHRSKRKSMAEKTSDPSSNSFLNPSTDHQILESSDQFPLHEISPSDLCSLMVDTTPESSLSFEENELSPSDLCSLMANIAPECSTSFEENEVWPSDLCSLMADTASENSKGFEENDQAMPSELCSLMIDNASEYSTRFEENEVSRDKMIFEDIENFWMEPFVEDIYDVNGVVAPLLGSELLDTEFLSLNSPFISDELLCSYGFSDEYVTKF